MRVVAGQLFVSPGLLMDVQVCPVWTLLSEVLNSLDQVMSAV